jgi:hypothetical protein
MSFKKIFFTRRYPKIPFELRPVTSENYKDVAKLYADVFSEEAVNLYFKVTQKMLYDYDCLPMATECMKANTGIACYDAEKNLLVGTLLYDDPIQLQDRFINSENELTAKSCAFTKVYKEENKELFDKLAKSKEGWLHGAGFSIHPEYQNFGIGKYMQYFSMFEHPVLKNVRYFTFDATSTYSMKIAQQFQFEEVWAKSWEDIAKIPGFEYYLGMIQGIRKMNLPFDEYYRLYLFDRNKAKPVEDPSS